MPFTDALATGILEKFGADPLVLGSVLVLLPTRRACRSLRESFLRARGGEPTLLPDIRPIADVDEEKISIFGLGLQYGVAEQAASLPPAIPAMRRQLLLSRLILEMDVGRRSDQSEVMDASQAVALARELAELLDQMQTERVSFTALDRVVPDRLANHWQQTLKFLQILTDHWPRLLAAEGSIDPADRRNRLLELQAEVWRRSPPDHPVVAAGSTGTIPATADLLKIVSMLPEGMVVLPALDQHMDDESWQEIDETHHQFGLRRLLAHLGVSRPDVPVWQVPGVVRPRDRAVFLSEALRPAETTHAWRDHTEIQNAALRGLSRIDCPGPEEEARTIALVMREVLESPERTAALVTPDRALARRVSAEVRRWNVEIDDSAGQPLGETPPGTFFRLVAQMVGERMAPVPLLAALKHPLACGGMAPGEFRRKVRALELTVLRGPRPARGIAGLVAALEMADAGGEIVTWTKALGALLAPFSTACRRTAVSITELLRSHVAACEALAAEGTAAGAPRMWAGDAGAELADFVDELHTAAAGMASIPGAEYAALLARLLGGRVVRPQWGRHPRLQIWGLLEARLQRADVMILGGLNEGTWPPDVGSDPWLSRPMRAAVGLPTPERRIGLTAHDFFQATNSEIVVLTRSEKLDGTPTVPSRWLLRIDALLDKGGSELVPDHPWLSWQEHLDAPDVSLGAAVPPEPRPPVAARPRRLAVTDIETWVRDPYSLFARRILQLRPLDPIDSDPGFMERGIFIHRALEEFVKAHGGALPSDAVDRLIVFGERTFGAALAQPAVWSFWWPRFQRIAHWFVEEMRLLAKERGTVPSAAEVRGEITIESEGAPFTLVARADRIDRREDGSLVIVDYKTGATPSQKDIELGLSPQLPLEAWIAQSGGFAGIEPSGVAELAYWRLSGSATAGEVRRVRADVDGLTERARAGLERLVNAFDDVATPYRARPRPRHATRFGDYAHLARVAEWAAGSDGDLS